MRGRPAAAAGEAALSPLYLYALLGDRAGRAGDLGKGLSGESLELVEVSGCFAAVGPMDDVPPRNALSLQAHDAVVSRLAASAPSILPARFGQMLATAADLAAALAPRAGELRRALRQVAGCVQMTLRLFAAPAEEGDAGEAAPSYSLVGLAPPALPADAGRGPGAAYIEARRQAASVPELEPLRVELASFLRAERVERSQRSSPLLATAYHLVPRALLEEYRRALQRATPRLGEGVRIVASGPWSPYAFGSELLP